MQTRKGFVGLPTLVLIALGLFVVGGASYVFYQRSVFLSVGSKAENDSDIQSGLASSSVEVKQYESEVKVLNEHFAVVEDQVYVFQYNAKNDLSGVKNIDAFQTFLESISTKPPYLRYSTLTSVDVPTFQVLNDSPYGYYAKDKYNVYYGATTLSGADPNTFVLIRDVNGGQIAKDSTRVYCQSQFLMGADPSSFTIVDSIFAKDIHAVYRTTAPNLYNPCVKVPFLDSLSFQSIRGSYYKDKNDVYRHVTGIETDRIDTLNADPNTFILFDGGYFSKDKNNIYAGSLILPGADPDSFSLLEGGYQKDNSRVYIYLPAYEGEGSTKVVASAEPKQFQVLDDKIPLAKDSDSVFVAGSILPDVSTEFHVLSPLQAEAFKLHGVYTTDGNIAYYFEEFEVPYQPKKLKIIGADFVTLVSIDGVYAKDKYYVYIRGKRIEEADVATFVSLGGGAAKDKNNRYSTTAGTYTLEDVTTTPCLEDCN